MEIMYLIDKIASITAKDFEINYIQKNQPVIIIDAQKTWNNDSVWTPKYLIENFGNEITQVYNNFFDLESFMSLKDYIAAYFNKQDIGPLEKIPYVRWYTKFRDVPFFWADALFEKLQMNWEKPYFLPTTNYVLPFSKSMQKTDPRTDYYPAKGLFISGRGAMTKLHIDPWASDSILCQVYGTKRWNLFSPEQGKYLSNGLGIVDLQYPDKTKFPNYEKAKPDFDFILEAGETIYVPHGWYHQVFTETDSISVTWNFVHKTNLSVFTEWLKAEKSDKDKSILEFFYKYFTSGPPTMENIEVLLKENFSDTILK
ncbi:cupin-like domain-containing protein [Leptospira santarosai]|uniref:cupin-like domain-containing protein n=1 Tax=Leptospira santarosai TaxID=28183 RepID=UPI000B11AC12|nr:cupin-like domain-containing protein [Leptospira santarosai]MDI7203692.1 cupin-like domain-containing protein [Leptospira santarosai]